MDRMFWWAAVVGKDEWPIRLNAPSDSLPRDCPKCARRKTVRLVRIYFRLSHHFTNLDDYLGKREPTILLCHYLCPYRESKPVYEGEELALVRGDKWNQWPRCRNW